MRLAEAHLQTPPELSGRLPTADCRFILPCPQINPYKKALAAFLASCSNPANPRNTNTTTRGDVIIGHYWPYNDPLLAPEIRVLSAPAGLTAAITDPWGNPPTVTAFWENEDGEIVVPVPPARWTIELTPASLVRDITFKLWDDYEIGEIVRASNKYTISIYRQW